MKSDMENNEWTDEEMSLKRFIKNNPFTVPSGYFEDAGQRLLSLIKLDELKSNDTTQGFAVPQNYFEELNANIQSRINIDFADTEERGFAVPEGYFEQLTNNIQSRINIEAALNTEVTGFAVPENYFDNLQQQISSRIAVEQILETSTPVFAVPDNYFEKLNRDILNNTINNQGVVLRKTIVRKLWASNTFKYATAACFALIIGAGAFLRQAQAPTAHTQTYLHTQLSEVPVDEIKDYLELHTDATDTQGLVGDGKQINIDALDADLQDYIEVN